MVTDVESDGKQVVAFGFSSFGRFAQARLLGDRFVPQLMAAGEDEIATESGENVDPLRAWYCMMRQEKPGGHGERCVAVGTLDMTLWDAAGKIAQELLYRHLGEKLGITVTEPVVPVCAGGGYYFESNDLERLTDEVRTFLALGYTRVKIKIGGRPRRGLPAHRGGAVSAAWRKHLAVDAMNRYDPESALRAAETLAPYGLHWFEDVCDPLDFETLASLGRLYEPPLACDKGGFWDRIQDT